MAGFYLFDKERFDHAINEFRCGRGELALIGEAQLAEGDPDVVLRALGGHPSKSSPDWWIMPHNLDRPCDCDECEMNRG